MTLSFIDWTEFRSLLDALCEETITPEQFGRLEELLLRYPEAEVYYVQYLSQHADVIRHFATVAPLSSVPASAVSGQTGPSRRRRGRLLLAVGLAGLAAALLLILMYHSGALTTPSPMAQTEPSDDSVAVLLQVHKAVWTDANLSMRPGVALPPGWLHLQSGAARIEFYSGATVILQGPADFKLVGRNEAYCERGSLRATVPPQAQGFWVGSPKLELVDRGTEFGLRVGADDKTEVHVFQGKVELHDGPQHAAALPRELTTGKSVRLERGGEIEPIPTDPASFETAEGLAARARALLRRRQQEWEKVSEEIRRDPDLKVYYTFRQQESWNRVLTDLALGRHPSQDGAIVGCSWTAGRWPGKDALEFKRVSNRVRFHVPGEFNSLTFLTWVCLDSLPNLNNSLMMSDGWKVGAPHWQIGDHGKLILGVQSNPRGKGAHYHAEDAITPKLFGQWIHLAVVYDHQARKVIHYVDGARVAEVPLEFDIPLHIGDAELGNWNLANHRNNCPVRFLNGCMDEFMMFGRALSAEEVSRLYEQGRPPS
jgi:Concanavalin A-like lectin/glucanases superfamily/FecR protein